jgi:hypothetical protein
MRPVSWQLSTCHESSSVLLFINQSIGSVEVSMCWLKTSNAVYKTLIHSSSFSVLWCTVTGCNYCVFSTNVLFLAVCLIRFVIRVVSFLCLCPSSRHHGFVTVTVFDIWHPLPDTGKSSSRRGFQLMGQLSESCIDVTCSFPVKKNVEEVVTNFKAGGHTNETGNCNATEISENCYQPELNTCSCNGAAQIEETATQIAGRLRNSISRQRSKPVFS